MISFGIQFDYNKTLSPYWLPLCITIYILFIKVPAPRLSRTPAIANISEKEPDVGQHTVDILSQELEYTSEDIKALLEAGVIECSNNSSKLWFLHEWLKTK